MEAVAQLAEHRNVTPAVAGSIPVCLPSLFMRKGELHVYD